MPAKASTQTTRLDGQQEIYFVASGQGTVTGGGQSAKLSRNIAVLVPAGLDFTLTNTLDEPLTMYVINEPTPPGFRPNSAILVRDENALPITSSDEFWTHIVKTVFVTADGLATLQAVLTVSLDPLTIARPHLHVNWILRILRRCGQHWMVRACPSFGNQLQRAASAGWRLYHGVHTHPRKGWVQTPHTNLNPELRFAGEVFLFCPLPCSLRDQEVA